MPLSRHGLCPVTPNSQPKPLHDQQSRTTADEPSDSTGKEFACPLCKRHPQIWLYEMKCSLVRHSNLKTFLRWHLLDKKSAHRTLNAKLAADGAGAIDERWINPDIFDRLEEWYTDKNIRKVWTGPGAIKTWSIVFEMLEGNQYTYETVPVYPDPYFSRAWVQEVVISSITELDQRIKAAMATNPSFVPETEHMVSTIELLKKHVDEFKSKMKEAFAGMKGKSDDALRKIDLQADECITRLHKKWAKSLTRIESWNTTSSTRTADEVQHVGGSFPLDNLNGEAEGHPRRSGESNDAQQIRLDAQMDHNEDPSIIARSSQLYELERQVLGIEPKSQQHNNNATSSIPPTTPTPMESHQVPYRQRPTTSVKRQHSPSQSQPHNKQPRVGQERSPRQEQQYPGSISPNTVPQHQYLGVPQAQQSPFAPLQYQYPPGYQPVNRSFPPSRNIATTYGMQQCMMNNPHQFGGPLNTFQHFQNSGQAGMSNMPQFQFGPPQHAAAFIQPQYTQQAPQNPNMAGSFPGPSSSQPSDDMDIVFDPNFDWNKEFGFPSTQ